MRKGLRGSRAKIFVWGAIGVQMYGEPPKREIENDYDLMEKFGEFQPCKEFFCSFIVFKLFCFFPIIFGCAGMRQPLDIFFVKLLIFSTKYDILN